jgi:hypothetical protein
LRSFWKKRPAQEMQSLPKGAQYRLSLAFSSSTHLLAVKQVTKEFPERRSRKAKWFPPAKAVETAS